VGFINSSTLIMSLSFGCLDLEAHYAAGENETSKDSRSFESGGIKQSEYPPCNDPVRSRNFNR
jgi:hypothetical protein